MKNICMFPVTPTNIKPVSISMQTGIGQYSTMHLVLFGYIERVIDEESESDSVEDVLFALADALQVYHTLHDKFDHDKDPEPVVFLHQFDQDIYDRVGEAYMGPLLSVEQVPPDTYYYSYDRDNLLVPEGEWFISSRIDTSLKYRSGGDDDKDDFVTLDYHIRNADMPEFLSNLLTVLRGLDNDVWHELIEHFNTQYSIEFWRHVTGRPWLSMEQLDAFRTDR